MKINKYTKALIILVTICYSTFLFGCNSKSDFGPYQYVDEDGKEHAYADGTDTAEEGHSHSHDHEGEEEHEHDHDHEGEEEHNHDHDEE